MIKMTVFLGIFACFGSFALGAECTAENRFLSLAELVAIALENHPDTKIAWWQAQKAAAALGDAKGAYYPSIDLIGGIQNGRDFKYINGPDAYYTVVGLDLFLTFMLYDFGERDADVEATKCALIKAN